LLLVAGFLKLPGGYVAGTSLAVLGLMLFGLSFVPRQVPAADAPPPMSLAGRLAGIFFEPSQVFRSLRAHPHWLAPLLITSLLSFAYSTAFTFRLTPERIFSFTNDKLVEKGWMPAEQAERMKAQQIEQARSPARVAAGATTAFLGAFVLTALIAALYMLGVLLFGGRMGYWQALAVAAWASLPPVVIGQLLNLVLVFVKDPDDIHPILGQGGLVTDNLGALVSPAESPILFGALSAFGVLAFYYLWLVATGLRHGGERVSSSSAWTLAIIFWGVGLLVRVASNALFGNFFT
jgi:hypothetical protein